MLKYVSTNMVMIGPMLILLRVATDVIQESLNGGPSEEVVGGTSEEPWKGELHICI